MGDSAEIVRRAEAYPFEPPVGSYVLGGSLDRLETRDRVPVLAVGSNASQARLVEKLGPATAALPVLRALIRGQVVVYSAHFARYGSVPATLAEAPGASCYAFVLWPDPEQLERLHESEALGRNYSFLRVAVDAEVEGLGRVDGVHAYVSLAGPLRIRGVPVRCAEVPSAGCPWPALFQPALLRLLHRRLDPEASYERFLARLVDDEDYRTRASGRLRRLA